MLPPFRSQPGPFPQSEKKPSVLTDVWRFWWPVTATRGANAATNERKRALSSGKGIAIAYAVAMPGLALSQASDNASPAILLVLAPPSPSTRTALSVRMSAWRVDPFCSSKREGRSFRHYTHCAFRGMRMSARRLAPLWPLPLRSTWWPACSRATCPPTRPRFWT